MTNKKAIEWFKNRIAVMPESETKEMFCMAVVALEKQEQDNNKSCDTCKYKNLPVSKFPCDECYFASDFEDYYEPYTEEES